jgi:hypothetical protein
MHNEVNKTIQLERLQWHDIHTELNDDGFRHSSDINVITSTIREAAMLLSLMKGFYEVCRSVVSRSMTYKPSFINIGSGLQTFLV